MALSPLAKAVIERQQYIREKQEKAMQKEETKRIAELMKEVDDILGRMHEQRNEIIARFEKARLEEKK